ncbi:hypothetical protein, partial [Cupriavidus sp. SK-3]
MHVLITGGAGFLGPP